MVKFNAQAASGLVGYHLIMNFIIDAFEPAFTEAS